MLAAAVLCHVSAIVACFCSMVFSRALKLGELDAAGPETWPALASLATPASGRFAASLPTGHVPAGRGLANSWFAHAMTAKGGRPSPSAGLCA